MKLFARYNQVNIIATILVLLIGSTCYYFIIRYILIKQLDDTLKVEEAEIVTFVKNNDSLPPATSYRDQVIAFEEARNFARRKFLQISLFDTAHNEVNPYRRLVFPVTVKGKVFQASVTKSEAETEDLLLLIVVVTIGVIVLLLLMLFIANRFLLRKIWQPFYKTLQSIGGFNISDRKVIPESNASVDEFKYLDVALNRMTEKIVRDYEMVQSFADNASHEMQTPLAIINSKLDLLIQDQGLDERQMKPLQEMYDAVGRMSKLNQSLLLLTKIGNRQFEHTDLINLKTILTDKLRQLEDIFHAKQMHVKTDLQDVSIELNSYLADILLNNLLSNAVHHNAEGGNIEIKLDPQKMSICNSGPALSFDASRIFRRFEKSSHSQGVGLGLAIVKQICDSCHFIINYTFDAGRHTFVIRF